MADLGVIISSSCGETYTSLDTPTLSPGTGSETELVSTREGDSIWIKSQDREYSHSVELELGLQ